MVDRCPGLLLPFGHVEFFCLMMVVKMIFGEEESTVLFGEWDPLVLACLSF